MARTVIAAADGTSLADFTQINQSAGDIQVITGKFNGQFSSTILDNAGLPSAVWSGAGSFTDNQYCEVTISGLTNIGGTSRGFGVLVRASTDTNGARDYYGVYVAADDLGGGSYSTYLFKVVNGTHTTIHSAGVSWVDGDEVSIEAEGTTLRACRNAVALGGSFTQTDSALTTGKPGLIGGAAGVVVGDDFVGGNITAGTTVPVFMNHLRTQGIA